MDHVHEIRSRKETFAVTSKLYLIMEKFGFINLHSLLTESSYNVVMLPGVSQVEIETILWAIYGQHSAFVKHESDDDTDTEPFHELDADAEIVNCKRKKDSVDLHPLQGGEEKEEFRAGMQRQGARSHKSVEDIIVQFLMTESSLILQILASLNSRNLLNCIPVKILRPWHMFSTKLSPQQLQKLGRIWLATNTNLIDMDQKMLGCLMIMMTRLMSNWSLMG